MFSKKVVSNLSRASWIRAMFEEGEKLRKVYGPDKVFDFSLGSPDVEPPAGIRETALEMLRDSTKGMHRYMSNAGYPDVRERVAAHLSAEHGIEVPASCVVMTCGAAGALNVVMKSLLDPGDEVIVFSPYFAEYLFYIDNHGGKPVVVPTDQETFRPPTDGLEKHITPSTRAVLINTPNNPTGVVYSKEDLESVAAVLSAAEEKFGHAIYLIADLPYEKLIYEGPKQASILQIYPDSIIVNSFSKSLSLAGERIGYIAASRDIKDVAQLMDCIVFCNRTLGFVNAPAMMQKVVARNLDAAVDIEVYRRKRDLIYGHLTGLGFKCVKPQGAFYLFPRSPLADDVGFVKKALKYNLLLVPGSGSGCPGHFRLAYCYPMEMLQRSLPVFTELAKEVF